MLEKVFLVLGKLLSSLMFSETVTATDNSCRLDCKNQVVVILPVEHRREQLLAGKTNRIICTNNGSFTDVDIDEALGMNRRIQKMEVEVLTAMTGI